MKISDMSGINKWNMLLSNMLAAIHQHFLHARILKYQGHMELADYEYKLSIECMRQADLLIEHILADGNIPNLQTIAHSPIETTPAMIIKADMDHADSIKKAIGPLLQTKQSENVLALLTTIQKNLNEQIQFLSNWKIQNCIPIVAHYKQIYDESTLEIEQRCA